MLDLGFVRTNLELVARKLRERGQDPEALLGDFRRLDAERREKITQLEGLQSQRNALSEQVGALKRAKQDAAALMEQVRGLKEAIDRDQRAADAIDEQLRAMLTRIPNLTRDEVPAGKDERDNVEVKRWGTPREFDFQAKPHWELGAELGILDLERAAKISGARFA
ncbi:MAG: serine--tRNA ligase, partial [Acidobacteriaceae bacterium]